MADSNITAASDQLNYKGGKGKEGHFDGEEMGLLNNKFFQRIHKLDDIGGVEMVISTEDVMPRDYHNI